MQFKTIVDAIAYHANQTPHRVCLIEASSNRTLTYSQLWQSSIAFSARLFRLGLEPGERVVVRVRPSDANLIIAIMGIYMAGGVYCPVERHMKESRVAEIMEYYDSRFLVASEFIKYNNPYTYINISDIPGEFEGVCQNHMDSPKPEDLCDIIFTTGTTGRAKGVMLSFKARLISAMDISSRCGVSQEDVIMPVNSADRVGFNRHIFMAFINGATAVLYDGTVFLSEFFRAVKQHKVTVMLIAPSVLAMLIGSPDELSECSHIIRVLRIGAAPVPVKHMEAVKKLLPHTDLYNICEPTESGCALHYKFSEYSVEAHCLGVTGEHTKAYVVDENHCIMADSSESNQGLLAYSGEANMMGYWKDTILTASVLHDGMLVTGDVGYIGKNGFVYLTSRKDDIINSGGHKIAPYEIEDIVMGIQGIKECACVPMRNKMLGQIPILFVAMDDDSEFSAKKIYKELSDRLETFKLPRSIRLIDELPKIGSAKKIDKKYLTQLCEGD